MTVFCAIVVAGLYGRKQTYIHTQAVNIVNGLIPQCCALILEHAHGFEGQQLLYVCNI